MEKASSSSNAHRSTLTRQPSKKQRVLPPQPPEKDQVMLLIGFLVDDCDSKDAFELKFPILFKILGNYQEQPQLLASHVVDLMNPLCAYLSTFDPNRVHWDLCSQKFHQICKVLQLICRVRGYKHVVKYLPHEVHHLETCLSCLKLQNPLDFENWETRFILLQWLSVLCLIPFAIDSFDDNLKDSSSNNNSHRLVNHIVELCKVYLSDPGPSQAAASLCLASLLTRPDLDSRCLNEFLVWSTSILSVGYDPTPPSCFRTIGILHCLGQILKRGHRHKLLAYAPVILESVSQISLEVNQTQIRKLLSKLLQRVALTFLPPCIASWRYVRGKRSLARNLQDSETVAILRSSVENALSNADATEQSIPHELESILEKLLLLMGDKDTVVRWSAAKGIGRITMLVPKLNASDIVCAVLEAFSDMEADANWHGGCLTLAELSRRGLLLPEHLLSVVPFVEKALLYDRMRGQHSIGAHVRDAACYVCWSFARAYSPEVMQPYCDVLSKAMLITAFFDREVNCRRAASAAFQENVGRQGNENFRFGIEIITVADYFSVGNRQNAYLTVALTVAAMCNSFNSSLFNHLCEVKVCHWDVEIRVLAANAIAKLACLDFELTVTKLRSLVLSCVSNQLSLRHGSLLAVSEILFVVSCEGRNIPADLLTKIVEIVPSIEKARLYRGKGGELIRQAVCKLIQSLAKSCVVLTEKRFYALIDSLNDHIRQPHDEIQKLACDALRSTSFHFVSNKPVDCLFDKLIDNTALKYIGCLDNDDNVAVTRGCARALGTLPVRLICSVDGMLLKIIDCLDRSSRTSKLIGGEYDAATCRNSVMALTDLVVKMCDCHVAAFDRNICERCLSILWRSCEDYSVDKRGDTGSWSRIAGLIGIEKVIVAILGRMQTQCRSVNSTELEVGDKLVGCEEVLDVVNIDKSISESVVVIQHTSAGLSNNVEFASNRVLMSKKSNVFVLDSSSSADVSSDDDWLSYDLLTGSMSVVLKQLSEKLDNVREVAGKILIRLLDHLPVVYSESAVIKQAIQSSFEICSFDDRHSIDWSDPATAYKIVVQMMKCPVFIKPILSGLVVSVGGLTESIANASTSALLMFCAEMKRTDEWNKFSSNLKVVLLGLFSEYRRNDRVIAPLIKCIDILMRNNVFDDEDVNETMQRIGWERDCFSDKLLASILLEMTKSINVSKLIQCLDMLNLLISYSNGLARFLAFKAMLKLLGHKFPVVRKACADLLYVQIECGADVVGLPYGSNEKNHTFGLLLDREDVNRAAILLTSIAWDSADKETIDCCRNELMSLQEANSVTDKSTLDEISWFLDQYTLQSFFSVLSEPKSKKEKQTAKADESLSYSSLVKEAGY